MAFLSLPDERTAPEPMRPLLAATAKRWGFVPNIVRAFALRPELAQAEDVWSQALMYHGALPRPLKEAIATTVSTVNDCAYCATSHA
ncbi:MAG: carboxymuconolactone decarboxylase family protein, partial [Halobacteriales archaeon]|nr:carboxymuconolactone decarboxylase family protein [Halobacteriales archaeon]